MSSSHRCDDDFSLPSSRVTNLPYASRWRCLGAARHHATRQPLNARIRPVQIDETCCLFLDVDGTLLEIAPRPDDVVVRPDVHSLLRSLSSRLDGALALVSGRSLAQLDRLFGDGWPAAGLHGLERRDAHGQVRRSDIEPQRLAAARALLANLGAQAPGLLLEDKGVALAMHYRNAPERADEVRASLEQAAADLGEEFHVQPGAQVLELKPRSATKATAIESFMCESPFAGRRPVFVGDDLTDLDGFAAVEAHGGLTIAVGPRIKGMLNLPGPDALLHLLEEVAAR